MDLEPTYASALAHAAWCHEQRIVRGWPPIGEDDVGTAVALARRAVTSGSDDAVALVLGGVVLVMVARDYDSGLDAVRRALERNPGSGFVALMASTALYYGGDPQGSLVHVERAMKLSPLDPGFFMFLTIAGLVDLTNGRPDRALEMAKRSVALYPDWDLTYILLIVALVRLGRLAEARAALPKFISLAPGLTTVSMLRKQLPLRNSTSLDVILDSFREAGLPE
jgi:adenylate cyclase